MSVRLPLPGSRRSGRDAVFVLAGRDLARLLDRLLAQDAGRIV